MKNLVYIIILMLGLTSCLKDKDLITPQEPNGSATPVVINEVFSTGDPDWVELYNTSSEDIDISGYGVSDGPTKKTEIPAGTIIPANGYYVYECNDFGLSSGGESFYLWDAEDNLVDFIDFPALDDGVAYGRSSDGASDWLNMSPTQGAANSTVNNPPYLAADEIINVNDNKAYQYTVVASDADGIRDVKIFVNDGTIAQIIEMAPIGGGEFVVTLPLYNADDEVEYYVVATDETGLKTYFPTDAPDTKNSFTVTNGLTLFESVKLSNSNPSDGEDINFEVKVYDKDGVDAVRLYYILNDQVADDKVNIDLTTLDGITWTGTIPGQTNGTKILYYLRATDNASLKSYYPVEEYDSEGNVVGDFDHDNEATWPSITVKPLTVVLNEIEGAGSPDYIELYNVTDASIDISGYKLHDSDPTEAYTIPEGTVIAAHGFYVLDCTGNGGTETLFKISSSGEDITLLDASDELVDRLLMADWPIGHSGLVGRVTDGAPTWEIKAVETKGTTNN